MATRPGGLPLLVGATLLTFSAFALAWLDMPYTGSDGPMLRVAATAFALAVLVAVATAGLALIVYATVRITGNGALRDDAEADGLLAEAWRADAAQPDAPVERLTPLAAEPWER